MPKGLTASTGMDALTHAIEGYTTKAAWEMTDMFHIKAIEIIGKSLRSAVENEKEGREGMALAISRYFSPVQSALYTITIGSIIAHATPCGVSYTAPSV